MGGIQATSFNRNPVKTDVMSVEMSIAYVENLRICLWAPVSSNIKWDKTSTYIIKSMLLGIQ